MTTTMTVNDTIRTELYAIAEQHQGFLAPEHVVEAARPEAHPLHPYFDWDNDAAAAKFRLAQAALLIRRVKLHIVKVEPKTKVISMQTTRAIESAPSARGKQGSYRKVESIMSDADERASLIASARAELRAIRARYERLEELAEVWRAIDALQ